eukprot:SAG22_NODE_424_length_10663_cov_93.402026_20_plen_212_part_00
MAVCLGGGVYTTRSVSIATSYAIKTADSDKTNATPRVIDKTKPVILVVKVIHIGKVMIYTERPRDITAADLFENEIYQDIDTFYAPSNILGQGGCEQTIFRNPSQLSPELALSPEEANKKYSSGMVSSPQGTKLFQDMWQQWQTLNSNKRPNTARVWFDTIRVLQPLVQFVIGLGTEVLSPDRWHALDSGPEVVVPGEHSCLDTIARTHSL